MLDATPQHIGGHMTEFREDMSKRLEKANEEIGRLKADIVSGLLRNHA